MLWRLLGVRNWLAFVNGFWVGASHELVAEEDQGTGKSRFYSGISPSQVQCYQRALNWAFELSPSMVFEPGDPWLREWLGASERSADLSKLDLEMMRLQYVLADRGIREDYRSMWAVTVICLEDAGFFPSPWEVLSALFSSRALSGEDASDPVGELV
jgi:hypothetical protein